MVFSSSLVTMNRLFRTIFVVASPPRIRRRLWPAFGRVFPGLLPAERRQVEECPDAAQGLDAARAGEIGAIDMALIVAQEHAKPVPLSLVSGHAEVAVEIAWPRRHPGDAPAHALSIGLDLCERRDRDEGERNVAGVEVGGMADLVDEH